MLTTWSWRADPTEPPWRCSWSWVVLVWVVRVWVVRVWLARCGSFQSVPVSLPSLSSGNQHGVTPGSLRGPDSCCEETASVSVTHTAAEPSHPLPAR
ncbi:hypothetical protein EYF80_066172 [Liparis tanakae]|uniref:Uncharacterized protein n=1 Tax=Liparis tanakae TaxID=230148 RepID=A0A4Z2E4G2_9TELE|nr:hypothetical protein EYF80_066172 [Liparis tanakae]